MAYTTQEIQDYLSANPGLTDQEILALAMGAGIDASQLHEAVATHPSGRWDGATQEQVEEAYSAPPPTVPQPQSGPAPTASALPVMAPTNPTPEQLPMVVGPNPATTPTNTSNTMAYTQEEMDIFNQAAAAGKTAAQVAAERGLPVSEVEAWLAQNNLNLSGTAPPVTTPPPTTTTPPPTTGTTPPTTGGGTTTPPTTGGNTQNPPVNYGPLPVVNLPAGSTTVPNTASAQDIARQNEAKEILRMSALGVDAIPGNLQATAQNTSLDGTITSQGQIEQIASPAPIGASSTGAAPVAPTLFGNAQTTGAIPGATASLIDDTTLVGQQAPTGAAQGQVSNDALTQQLGQQQLSQGATAQAEQITQANIEPGAMVEAAVGTMSPEAIAEAATVAGLEAARVTRAKEQLRKAGLTDLEIANFANDPNALEMKLSDFTEEQRGLIGGLPVEALVSTQMDALLQGIESGNTPAWAKPAVTAVEQMLARRGMSASTVGRDSLINAIIQSAMPLAQQNAEAIQNSVLQQRGFEQQASLAEAQFKQQATLQNAQNVFTLDLANLSNEQQANLANSQFLQTVTLTNANNRQQAAMQNAVSMANLDLATLDANTRLAAQNAQAFLQMDLTNVTNQQQSILLDSQIEQQRLLTNAAAANATKQFNASSETQVSQFMASLAANIAQFNTQQVNAMSQFNTAEANKQAAINAGNQVSVEQFNAQLETQVRQFNAQQELAVEQWNSANAQAIEQSNVQWRRQANTADTAAQNAVNQQNVQNAFNMTLQSQAALWQELRDQATFNMQSYENRQDREAQLYATAIGNESAAGNSYDHTTHLVNLARSFFGG